MTEASYVGVEKISFIFYKKSLNIEMQLEKLSYLDIDN